jgi:glycosyltransferase involved in cell wall biosynthesis
MSRTLFVTHTPIVPVRSGSTRRRLNLIHALGALGPVDVLHVGECGGADDTAAIGEPVADVLSFPARRRSPSAPVKLAWLAHPTEPFEVLEWDRRSTADSPVAGRRYDVVWYCRALGFALAPPVDAPVRIVDLDDLEDDKLTQRLADGGLSGRARLITRRNALAWARCQRRIATAVDAVTVCSDDDRARLGVPNGWVVPNGVPAPTHVERRPEPCTVLLIGFFPYEPNTDAAEFFVRDVLPPIVERMPDVRVRLVGRPSDRVRALAGPRVEVVGEVPDMAAELARATITVAPVRLGSGTRVKIIEAFAAEVPVVATPLGAAGLDAVDGEHCLVASTATDLADACVRLLGDPSLRARLVDAAAHLYRRRFSTERVDEAVLGIIDTARSRARLGLEYHP